VVEGTQEKKHSEVPREPTEEGRSLYINNNNLVCKIERGSKENIRKRRYLVMVTFVGFS